jgi:hypothetical protein
MMSNVQLLLSIGIPSLLIVLSWINNNSRFDRIEKRLDDHDQKFNAMDRRFERMDGRFNDVNAHAQDRFDQVIAAGHKDALEILRAMISIHERLTVVETRQNR